MWKGQKRRPHPPCLLLPEKTRSNIFQKYECYFLNLFFRRQKNVAKRRRSEMSRTPCLLKTPQNICLPNALTAASTPNLGRRTQSFA